MFAVLNLIKCAREAEIFAANSAVTLTALMPQEHLAVAVPLWNGIFAEFEGREPQINSLGICGFLLLNL